MNRLIPYGVIIFIVAIIIFLLRLNQKTLELTALVIGVILVVCMGVGLFLFLLTSWQQFRILKAKAKLEEYKTESARYNIHQDGFGMLHLHDLKTNILENLSANPTTHHNGTWVEPHPAQAAAWHALVGRRGSESPVNRLEASHLVIEQKQSLLELIDSYPHCHIYGGSGVGKTGLLRSIAYHRQKVGHQVLVLDSAEHPSKWKNLTRLIKREKQNEAISKLFSIYRQNEEALSSGKAIESDFNQISVLSDEWTDIVLENELARQFIREQVRKVRKYGIHLIFSTQTDLAEDLGLSGSYKTVNSFLKLELKKLPNGGRVAIARIGHQNLGEFIVPNPPPLPELLSSGYIAPSIEQAEPVKIVSKEERIIELSKQGLNLNEIALDVFGSIGGNQNRRIRAVLENKPQCK